MLTPWDRKSIVLENMTNQAEKIFNELKLVKVMSKKATTWGKFPMKNTIPIQIT
jgi:hypothetical protein